MHRVWVKSLVFANTGENHTVYNSVFSVSSYILVLRFLVSRMAINQMVKERWSCILAVQNKAASDKTLQERYVLLKAVSYTFYKALLTKFGRMLNIAPFLRFCSELLRQKGITKKGL